MTILLSPRPVPVTAIAFGGCKHPYIDPDLPTRQPPTEPGGQWIRDAARSIWTIGGTPTYIVGDR